MTTAMRMTTVLVLVATTAMLQAQARPYLGSWRVNSAKSDTKGVTATYKELPGNRLEISGMGQKETFVIGRDGKEYPWVGGTTTTWRDTSPTRWDSTVKSNGRLISSAAATLSADGNTITLDFTNVGSDGKPMKSKGTLQRVSGGPGALGTWRLGELPGGVEIRAQGDGVLFRWLDYAEAVCRFDGKDCVLKGGVPDQSTIALRELGPRSFEYLDKTKGVVNYTSRFTLSEDGATLTEDETLPTGEKYHIVYERQK